MIHDDNNDEAGREGNLFIGVINAMRITSHVALWAIALYLLSGCSTVRPLAEYQHVSHASDGLGGPGFDTLSLGIRWRPMEGVTVDLLEGYSPNKLNNRNEIFTGRVQVEF